MAGFFDRISISARDGGVGEVVNTLVCGTSMHEFDPHTPPQNEMKSILMSRFFLFGRKRLVIFGNFNRIRLKNILKKLA